MKEKMNEKQRHLEAIYKNDLTFSEYIVEEKMQKILQQLYQLQTWYTQIQTRLVEMIVNSDTTTMMNLNRVVQDYQNFDQQELRLIMQQLSSNENIYVNNDKVHEKKNGLATFCQSLHKELSDTE